MSFHLDEVSCLRELNHQYIDVIIERRRQWREISLQRWNNSGPINKNIVTRRAKEITDDNVKNLHTLTDVLLRSRVDFKLVTSVSSAWIYTNNIALVEQLKELDFLIWPTYTQAVINRPKNTIRLKQPKHTHRSYLRSVKLTEEEKIQLRNFFTNQVECIRISPALLTWMGDKFYRTQDYFFVDHNEKSWLIMLSLIKPGLVRKTVELIAA
jgi:hypothetical protein